MKTIPLNNGYEAVVDDDDYEYLSQFKWRAKVKPKDGVPYAVRSCGRHVLYMHREVMSFPDRLVDHRNGNTLDNRRENLRSCNAEESARNRGVRKDSTTGFKGVSPATGDKKGYRARVYHLGKRYELGVFKTPEDAALAYNRAASRLFGEFARLNEVS